MIDIILITLIVETVTSFPEIIYAMASDNIARFGNRIVS